MPTATHSYEHVHTRDTRQPKLDDGLKQIVMHALWSIIRAVLRFILPAFGGSCLPLALLSFRFHLVTIPRLIQLLLERKTLAMLVLGLWQT